MLHTLILVAHIIAAVALVALVLLQQGKGADAGAAFGSGSSRDDVWSARCRVLPESDDLPCWRPCSF